MMDADICINIQREHPTALAWFNAVTEELTLPGFVAIELMDGCQNSADLRKAKRFIHDFTVIWPTDEAMNRALMEFTPLHVSDGLGGMDALIAATAIEYGVELLTS